MDTKLFIDIVLIFLLSIAALSALLLLVFAAIEFYQHYFKDPCYQHPELCQWCIGINKARRELDDKEIKESKIENHQ